MPLRRHNNLQLCIRVHGVITPLPQSSISNHVNSQIRLTVGVLADCPQRTTVRVRRDTGVRYGTIRGQAMRIANKWSGYKR